MHLRLLLLSLATSLLTAQIPLSELAGVARARAERARPAQEQALQPFLANPKPEYGPSTIVAANLTIGEVGRGLCLVQAPCEIELDGKSIAGVEVDVKDLYDRKILGK